MKRISKRWPRCGHFDLRVVGRVRAWWWRYWPDHCELVASLKRGRMSPDEAVLGLLAVRESTMAKRIETTVQGLPNLEPLAHGGQWAAELPQLTAFMVDCNYDDGAPRKGGRLFISVERGSWVVVLKDQNQGLQLEIAVEKPEQMLHALEAALSSPSAPWRIDQWAKSRSTKQKK